MRVKPLADVCPIYDSEDSELPDAVRLLMDNHTVQTYQLNHLAAADQCHQRIIAIIQKWNEEDEVIGYQYKPRHEQKESRRGKFLRLMGLGQ